MTFPTSILLALGLASFTAAAPLTAQLSAAAGPGPAAPASRIADAPPARVEGSTGMTFPLDRFRNAGSVRVESAPAGWTLRTDTAEIPLDLRIARIARSPGMRESAALQASSAIIGLAAFPGTVLLAGVLYGAGEARDDEELSEFGLRLGTASTGAIGASVGVKLLVGRARPDISPEAPNDVAFGRGFRGNDYQSFPSAHTAAAFATATVLTTELGTEGAARFWLPPTAYGLASLAGLSRVYHDEHWFTDIVAGAIVGLASGVVTAQLIDE